MNEGVFREDRLRPGIETGGAEVAVIVPGRNPDSYELQPCCQVEEEPGAPEVKLGEVSDERPHVLPGRIEVKKFDSLTKKIPGLVQTKYG